jgi:hypothetical protein
MQAIFIRPSSIARRGFAGIVSVVSMLWALFASDLLLWSGMQLLILIQAYRIWKTTVGLARPLRLFRQGDWYLESEDLESQELLSVVPGLVSPRLITAELRSSGVLYRIVVPSDGLPPAEHWQLRRLVLQGVSGQKGKT